MKLVRDVRPENVSAGLYRLDLRGYVCPYPQIFTTRALKLLGSGIPSK